MAGRSERQAARTGNGPTDSTISSDGRIEGLEEKFNAPDAIVTDLVSSFLLPAVRSTRACMPRAALARMQLCRHSTNIVASAHMQTRTGVHVCAHARTHACMVGREGRPTDEDQDRPGEVCTGGTPVDLQLARPRQRHRRVGKRMRGTHRQKNWLGLALRYTDESENTGLHGFGHTKGGMLSRGRSGRCA